MTDMTTVTKIAQLAKIGLTTQETESLQRDLTRILDFVSELNQVKTEGVEPLVNPAFLTSPLRSDHVIPDGTIEEILENAPLKEQNMFLVPKIVEAS